MKELNTLLDYLEEHLNETHILDVEKRLKASCNFEDVTQLPLSVSYPDDHSFAPAFTMEETHSDMAKMLYNELLPCVKSVQIKDDSLPMIRANYGVGTLPSLFGMKSTIVGNNMPWVEHTEKENIDGIISAGVPDLDTGYGKKIIDTYHFFDETLSAYPKCHKLIKRYHPDLQGPFDVAHMIWGSDIYMDLYYEPEKVKRLMKVITDTYIAYLKKLKPYLNDETDGYNYHWSTLFKGRIVLRNDSAVNLSKDMYEEFIKPYDEEILEAFGSGSIHYCGRADQWVLEMIHTKHLEGMNFGRTPNGVFGQSLLDELREGFTAKRMPIHMYVITKEEYENLDKDIYKTGLSLMLKVDSREEAMTYLNR